MPCFSFFGPGVTIQARDHTWTWPSALFRLTHVRVTEESVARLRPLGLMLCGMSLRLSSKNFLANIVRRELRRASRHPLFPVPCMSLLDKVAPEPLFFLVLCGLLSWSVQSPSHRHVISCEPPIHMVESKKKKEAPQRSTKLRRAALCLQFTQHAVTMPGQSKQRPGDMRQRFVLSKVTSRNTRAPLKIGFCHRSVQRVLRTPAATRPGVTHLGKCDVVHTDSPAQHPRCMIRNRNQFWFRCVFLWILVGTGRGQCTHVFEFRRHPRGGHRSRLTTVRDVWSGHTTSPQHHDNALNHTHYHGQSQGQQHKVTLSRETEFGASKWKKHGSPRQAKLRSTQIGEHS